MRFLRAPACALVLLLVLPAVAGAASAQSIVGAGLSDALLVSALRDRAAEQMRLIERSGGIENVRAEADRIRDERRDAQRELVELRERCSDRLADARDERGRADTRGERRDARDDVLRVRDECLDEQDDLRDEIRARDRDERRIQRAFPALDLGEPRESNETSDSRGELGDVRRGSPFGGGTFGVESFF